MTVDKSKRIAVLSPVAWRTPPRQYGAWETVASNIAEGLVARGWDVTLFATLDSITAGKLSGVIERGYEEDPEADAKICECLHISALMERANEFDLIHNNYDFLPLTYSRLIDTPMLTTIHGFSSDAIRHVYRKYKDSHFVSISDSDRDAELPYLATVYNGIDMSNLTVGDGSGDALLFLGRIHPDKGTHLAIEVAKRAERRLIIAGIIQDRDYFEGQVEPHIDHEHVQFIGPVNPRQRDAILKQAAAVLHLNTIPERFGLVMAEANGAGVPVIAMDLGSCREVIEDGETGFLVNGIDEAVEAVGKVKGIDPKACRRRVEKKFSVETMVAGYEDVYGTIFAGG